MWRQLLCQRRHVLQFFLRMINPRIPFNFELGLNPFLSRFPQDLKSEKSRCTPRDSDVPTLSFSSLHLITSVAPDDGQKRTFSLNCFQSYGNKDDIHSLAEIPDPELYVGCIMAKSFTVEILAHAEAHVLKVLPCDGTNYIAVERLLSLGLGLAALMSQQDKYGKVLILLLLQPRPF